MKTRRIEKTLAVVMVMLLLGSEFAYANSASDFFTKKKNFTNFWTNSVPNWSKRNSRVLTGVATLGGSEVARKSIVYARSSKYTPPLIRAYLRTGLKQSTSDLRARAKFESTLGKIGSSLRKIFFGSAGIFVTRR